MEERIVCAANKDISGALILGVRHWDTLMYTQAKQWPFCDFDDQGFITNKGRFVDRQEAWSIAVKNNQIIRRCGGDSANGGTLFSENLY